MAKRSTQAAAYAFCAALASCGPDAPSPPKPKAEEPVYDEARPVRGLSKPKLRDDGFRRGISLGMFSSSEDEDAQREHYARRLDEIREVGATDVELVVEWSQSDVSAIEITPHPTRTIDDDVLTWVMDQASERGLRVFLMPVIDIQDRDQGKWRGTIAPNDWERWWWSYQRFIAHYARIAEGHKAEMLSIGSELLTTESDRESWTAVIEKVRKIYSGRLAYSARWDHFEKVSFWDDIDVVDITGYQALARSESPSDLELQKGAQAFAAKLQKWALARGKRYVLTEVGYPPRRHAAQRPWDERPTGKADALLQLRCYRAFYQACHDDPRLDGLYVWRFFGEGEKAGDAYSPRGRPAADVIAHWYTQSASAPPKASAKTTTVPAEPATK